MSMRTSCLFRLGAVRRLPMLDGSWELDSTSDLGILEELGSSTVVDKSNGRLFRGYTRYSGQYFCGDGTHFGRTDRAVRTLRVVPVLRGEPAKRIDDIFERNPCQGRRGERPRDEGVGRFWWSFGRCGGTGPGGNHDGGFLETRMASTY
jgi:hypothetical protein